MKNKTEHDLVFNDNFFKNENTSCCELTLETMKHFSDDSIGIAIAIYWNF